MQDVAGTQRASGVAAKLPEGKGTFAAEIIRHVKPAAQAQIAAHASVSNIAHPQRHAPTHKNNPVVFQRLAVQAKVNLSPGHHQLGIAVEFKRRAAKGDLQRRGAVVIAQQTVAETQRPAVHRPGRWHPHRPVARAPRVVLHRGLRASAQHLKGEGLILQPFQTAGPGFAAGEWRKGQNLLQIAAVRLHAVQAGITQRGVQGIDGRVARGSPGDDFRQHRIKKWRDFAAGLYPGVDAQGAAVIRREHHLGEQTRRRLELTTRIFRIDPRLNGMPRRGEAFSQGGQRRQRSGRQLYHPAHQVHAPHLLGNAMLHLQTGIDLKEIEASGVAVIDKLYRARAAVVNRLAQGDRGRTERIGHPLRQVGRGRLFQHFLVTALYRAITHAEGDHLPLAVAKQLDFKMPRPLDVLLNKDARIAEVVFTQPHHRIESIHQFRGGITHAHPDPTSARGAFQHHRVTHLLCRLLRLVHICQQFSAFQHRHALGFGQSPGGMFQAKQAQLLRRGTDEGNTGLLTRLGEGGVFRQKAVARMDSLGTAGFCGGDNVVADQIGVRRRAVAQAQGLVGLANMQAADIRLGIDRHAANVHGAQCAQNAAGNRPAVGNQEFCQHSSDSIVAGRPAENWLTAWSSTGKNV